MRPSPQQETIYDFVVNGRGSANVIAVAGAGKTTTLINAVKLMKGTVAFAAYNKKIADEIKNRLAEGGVDPRTAKAGTFHSFGLIALRKPFPNTKIDDRKTAKLLDMVHPGSNGAQIKIGEEYHEFVTAAVSLAKQRAIGVLTPFADAAAWNGLVDHFELDQYLTGDVSMDGLSLDRKVQAGLVYAQTILHASTELAGELIDFDDMIYLPLVKDLRMWQNDWVLVDEAQDTNPARRALARKMLRPNGRLLAVGDPCQAIYGFTGADSDSMDLIAREFNCRPLPLTVTYRCPKAVVRHAQNWVGHIEAHESAPQGEVITTDIDTLMKSPAQSFLPTDAILCRNTKPLIAMAFELIRNRMACRVEGRDIGGGLKALATKWKLKTCEQLKERLEEYFAKEAERLNAKGQEQKVANLEDRVETLMVIIEALERRQPEPSIQQLTAEIDSLFQEEKGRQMLTLATVHTSKGREWDRVFLLGRNKYMPSKYARQQWQMTQENNLVYVAITRAKKTLVEVFVP